MANAAQTPKALAYIEASFIWIPMALCAVIGVVMCFYKLDKERAYMDVELERRRTFPERRLEPVGGNVFRAGKA